ncbi:MAG: Trk system potassium transporter TrkA [Acidaminococcaceae bacterium]|nr:Trk system potassium transporter TrkA [Acidaminococcaceae bacterium]
MRIVVVGAGKLGYSVAQLLADDQYDVVVIEQDEKRREVVKNSLDVLTIGANGASPMTMQEGFVKDADMLLASTDSDEANMIICSLAKQNGVKHTVARIRNTDYAQLSDAFLKDTMKIDMILNPEQITAKEINRILMTPAALNVEDYAEGRVRMFEVKLRKDSPFAGIPLKKLEIPKQILVAMIFRNNEMIIPHGDDVMRDNDHVFFVGGKDVVHDFESEFTTTHSKAERVIIIGAGRTGRFLAPLLEQQGLFVKIIDKNKERCQLIAQKLNRGIALHGDGTDIDLLVEEGIAEADVVVCVTEDDKLNLLLALLAKHLGAAKTIVRVARNEYVELMEKVGVDIVLSSRLLSSGEVLRFIRRGGVVSVSLLEGAKAEAIELILPENSPIAGKKLRDAALDKECLVCAVVHDNEVVVPNGDTVLWPGDRVVIFVKAGYVKIVMPAFEGQE